MAKRKVEEKCDDYSSKEYWDARYQNGVAAGHVWYFDFDVLKPLLTLNLFPTYENHPWEMLEIGCGDQPLLPSLVQDDFFSETKVAICIDYSPAVTRMMRIRERQRRISTTEGIDSSQERENKVRTDGGMKGETGNGAVAFETADARCLDYANNAFHIVFDKGTIDAMMCSDEDGHENAYQICCESIRVINIDGCFIVISHMSPSSENGDSFIRECLCRAIMQYSHLYKFDIGVHFDEGCEEEGPFVYVIRKSERKVTRSKSRRETDSNIPINMHMY